MLVQKLLNRKALEPAVQDFPAWGVSICGSAIGKPERMAKHTAVNFLIVIIGNHTYTPKKCIPLAWVSTACCWEITWGLT